MIKPVAPLGLYIDRGIIDMREARSSLSWLIRDCESSVSLTCLNCNAGLWQARVPTVTRTVSYVMQNRLPHAYQTSRAV
jgi:hypothetical protein